MSQPSAPHPLLSTHARTLSSYRHALTHAEAQQRTLSSSIQALQASLSASQASEAAWRKRVQELDRLSRIQALELQAAKRGAREAGQELARVRVELEDVRRGVKRVRCVAGVDETLLVQQWARREGVAAVCCECECGAARAVRGLFVQQQQPPVVVEQEEEEEQGGPEPEPDNGMEPAVGQAHGSGGWAWGQRWGAEDRERRRLLKEKLRIARERVGDRLERDAAARTGARGGGGTGAPPTFSSRVV
ncbi:hypothetical protein FN846DRAFT_968653 [Sphaerosporella brunnea]|uniref:Uncharacterized protein n=1 Tax=Sphaerosporella brunnea TaxID=1250544 RepID=A0A5J5EKD4_9PEZI|nr:hypothetical protein FN846DRAFT_968653 [Sphaerosporella brunnea]